MREFAGAFFFVALLLAMSFAFTIATSIRFEDPCSTGNDLHCSIPECHCGTPNQRSGCREQNRPERDICYPDDFKAYQKSGGDANSWKLCGIAAGILLCALPLFVNLTRKVLRLHRVPATDVDAQVIADFRDLSARLIVIFGGLYAAWVFCFGLSIFAGVVLAQKKVDDFVYLPGVAQALLYVGIIDLVISSGFLAFVYKGRQRVDP